MQKRLIPFILAVVIIIGFGYFLSGNKSLKNNHGTLGPSASPIPLSFSNWGTFKNGYEIKIPENWINTSDLNGHAVIERGKNGVPVGSFTKIVISVSANSQADQQMTNQDDFDKWYSKSNKEVTKEILQKLDNTMIDKEKAVEFVDTSVDVKTQNVWSVVVWIRKNDVNYYINVFGNKKITPTDFKAYDYLIKSFKFPIQ